MRVLFRSAACLLAAVTACAPDPVGVSFASEGELMKTLGDYATVGRFAVDYPAQVTRVESSDHGLRFDLAGQRHEYGPEFGPLKIVYLKSNAGNGALVVRANARP